MSERVSVGVRVGVRDQYVPVHVKLSPKATILVGSREWRPSSSWSSSLLFVSMSLSSPWKEADVGSTVVVVVLLLLHGTVCAWPSTSTMDEEE